MSKFTGFQKKTMCLCRRYKAWFERLPGAASISIRLLILGPALPAHQTGRLHSCPVMFLSIGSFLCNIPPPAFLRILTLVQTLSRVWLLLPPWPLSSGLTIFFSYYYILLIPTSQTLLHFFSIMYFWSLVDCEFFEDRRWVLFIHVLQITFIMVAPVITKEYLKQFFCLSLHLP